MRLHDPASVVRFAIESHLQAHKLRSGDGSSGRRVVQQALSIGDSAMTERLQSRDRLPHVAAVVEELGLAPHGLVTRLVGQVGLAGRPAWTVGPSWWPKLRNVHSLGTESSPNFSSPVQVLLAAEAFAAHHVRLLAHPPNSTPRAQDESYKIACNQLLSQLCWLASGPFGVAHEAQRLISHLAPLAQEVVTDFIRGGVVTTQVIRALDRSLRQATWNSRMRQEYYNLLATPPARIYRRTNWLRALRRLQVTDFRNSESFAKPPKSRAWLGNQLLIAMKSERAYSGARATDRRYAFWCLAELTLNDSELWEETRRTAEADLEVAPLLERAGELRRYLGQVPVSSRDAFDFYPTIEWSTEYLGTGLHKMLRSDGVTSNRWPFKQIWSWSRAPLRDKAIALLPDALFNPDVIRQRSAIDAFRAAGAEVRESISQTIVGVMSLLDELDNSPAFLRERCLAFLGMLGSASAVPAVERALRSNRVETLAQAVSTAGDLAHLHPEESYGLMGWTLAEVSKHADDEDVMLAAVQAVVARGWDPRARLEGVLREPSEVISSALMWADRVLADPLLPD